MTILTKDAKETKKRLESFLTEHNMSRADFVSVANVVAEKNNMRGWTKGSGQTTVGRFVNYKNATLADWGIALVNATLDHLSRDEGITPTDIQDDDFGPMDYITEETLLNILYNFKVQVENEMKKILKESNGTSSLKKQYAELLLKSELPLDEAMVKRLDKLVGV